MQERVDTPEEVTEHGIVVQIKLKGNSKVNVAGLNLQYSGDLLPVAERKKRST